MHCLGEQVSAAEPTERTETTTPGTAIRRLTEENYLLTKRIETLGHRINDLTDDLTAERRAARYALQPGEGPGLHRSIPQHSSTATP